MLNPYGPENIAEIRIELMALICRIAKHKHQKMSNPLGWKQCGASDKSAVEGTLQCLQDYPSVIGGSGSISWFFC